MSETNIPGNNIVIVVLYSDGVFLYCRIVNDKPVALNVCYKCIDIEENQVLCCVPDVFYTHAKP